MSLFGMLVYVYVVVYVVCLLGVYGKGIGKGGTYGWVPKGLPQTRAEEKPSRKKKSEVNSPKPKSLNPVIHRPRMPARPLEDFGRRGSRSRTADCDRRRSLEKWEVLLGIRLPGTGFWRGLSSHQAASAQMGT